MRVDGMGIGKRAPEVLKDADMKKTDTHTKKQSNTRNLKKARQIKLGLDISAKTVVVVRQLDGATPQPAQSYGWKGFLQWAEKQVALAEEVYSCYEAGPFGYKLHRQLQALGIRNVVIRPVKLDVEHRGVKTDRTDALELCAKLDRYVGGNRKALSVIRVPTAEQELARSQSRQRQQIQEHRKRWEAQGRSLLLYYGLPVSGQWWQGKAWAKIQEEMSPGLGELVEPIQREVIRLYQMEVQRTQSLSSSAPVGPVGFGGYTQEVLKREMQDWQGFKNRRQVGSITGLCPGVSASGNYRKEGCITRRGRPRVRTALIELAWRLTRYQPDYPPVKQFHQRCARSQSRAVRKKAIVALARRVAIDLWRLATERVTAAQLGLRLPK